MGRKGDLIYFRGNSTDVDINELRPASKIPDDLGFGGTLHLHSAKTKIAIRYLSDSQTLFSAAETSDDILQNKQKTWANTDTLFGTDAFLRGNWTDELHSTSGGRGSLRTFIGFLGVSSDFTGLTKGAKQKIQQLRRLIIRLPMVHKRAPIADKMWKSLVYGDQQMPETQIRIEKI